MSEIPGQIGPYSIEDVLGSGGMGTVYRGRHSETGQIVAVKVLPAAMSRDQGMVARFEREIGSLGQLKNPHIVELYEHGIDNEIYYYAMECVDGETIADRLRREKRIPWPEVIDISVQVCTALKAAHDAGIVHRDLKPSNLMVTSDGIIKLTDFGIAQVFAANKLTITGGIVGTAEYMSPEQAQGTRATKKSDLYSLGAVMYVMLTGRPPFSGKTMIDIIQKQRYGQFDRPSLYVDDLPHWLEEIVNQLLEKEPDKRYPDAFVLSRRLQEVIKKVKLSREEEELSQESPTMSLDSYDGFAPTVTAEGQLAEAGPHEFGSGTLMRDLMRAEIERSQQPSPVERVLNNTWVLIGLFLLLIVGGVWWFQPRDLSPEEMFRAGVELLDHSEGSDWRMARDRYFLPLMELDPDNWDEKVSPYLKKIEEYKLKQQLQPGRLLRTRLQTQSEPERIFLLARHLQEVGDIARAVQTLKALSTLLADDPEQQKLYNLTQELLQQLRKSQTKDGHRYDFLQSAITRAIGLAKDNQLDKARNICTSIIELYGMDDDASDYVERARQLLNQEATAGP